MRVLFIDFDGVLHAAVGPPAAMRRYVWSPLLEELLLPFPDITVVVHASARDHTPLPTIVSQLGPLGQRIVDIAPPRVERWPAICTWLASHPEVSEYWILDDAAREFPAELEQLIVCGSRTGINDVDVQLQLKQWLEN